MQFIRRTRPSFRFFSNSCSGSDCFKKDKNVNFVMIDAIMDTSIHQTNMNMAIMDTLIQQTNEIKYMKYELLRLHDKINRINNSIADIPCSKKD